MVYFTQQSTSDVGIGNTLVFSTEQHPKKRENRVGMLSMHVYEHRADTTEPRKVIIKCSKVDPVLTGRISRDLATVGAHRDALHKHINAYLCNQYTGFSWKSDRTVLPLSDSLYVLGIQMAKDDDCDGEYFTSKTFSPVCKEAAGKPNTAARKNAPAKPPNPIDFTGLVPMATGVPGATTPDGVVFGAHAKGTGTMVDIKFCRVEDVPMIMQACRVFFRNVACSGKRPEVMFARGVMPGWWKLGNDTPFDFKKTRDTFDNIEVVEQVRTRRGIHYFSCFAVEDADVTFSTRVKNTDGSGWLPVIYVDFPKLIVLDQHALPATQQLDQ